MLKRRPSFGGSLVQWGVEPRVARGLPGILLHPFLHGSPDLGRPGPHIGASGVVFGFFGYLLCTGVFE